MKVNYRWLGIIGIVILIVISYPLHAMAQDSGPTQEKKEPEKKKSFLSRLAGKLAKDISASGGLIQWHPAPAGRSGSATPSEAVTYKGGEWVVAPIPISNPTVGSGLAGGVGYIYRLKPDDKLSPPTITGAGGMGTSNKSWGIGGIHRMTWRQDRFRLNGAAVYANINYVYRPDFSEPDGDRLKIPINLKGTFVATDFLTRIFERVFVGPRVTAIFSKARPNIELDSQPETGSRLEDLLTIDTQLISFGLEVMRDTRDSLFYQRSGTYGLFRADVLREGMGSDFSYEKYNGTFSIYQSLGTHQVLAATANVCGINGEAPFFDECYLGLEKNVRGYDVAFKQGTALFAAQAEYRLELFWRIGLVGFFGVGQVANGYDNFTKDGWQPGGGFGIRFLVAKENHVNLRLDFAWGRGSRATYLSAGEAF